MEISPPPECAAGPRACSAGSGPPKPAEQAESRR